MYAYAWCIVCIFLYLIAQFLIFKHAVAKVLFNSKVGKVEDGHDKLNDDNLWCTKP